jgi:hypothetical protein
MRAKRIIRYENETSRDDYHTYGIRESQEGYQFFCLLETFFRRAKNSDSFIPGSITSYHVFGQILGITKSSLILTTELFIPRPDYKIRLLSKSGLLDNWMTVD